MRSIAKKDPIASTIAARRNQALTRQDLVSLLVRVAVIALALYVVFTQIFLMRQVSGMDMFPALKDGDLAVVYRLQDDLMKDDVVAYQTIDGPRFGRIAARGGDVVTIGEDGILQVNGTTQSGEILYPTYAVAGIEYPYRVPEGHLFLLGDYRTKATDSRTYGPISEEDVDGKVITILRRRGL